MPGAAILREVLHPKVLLLGLAYFGLVNTLIANSLWVPQIVRSVVPNASYLYVGVVTAVPSLCALAISPLWSWSSDRRNERTWHLIAALMLTVCGWLCVGLSAVPLVKFAGLALCSIGVFAAQSLFWTLPVACLSPAARPIGIATVNSIGVSGSVVGPVVIGALRDRTHSFTAGLLFVAAMLAVSACCVLLLSIRFRADRNLAEPAPQIGPNDSVRS